MTFYEDVKGLEIHRFRKDLISKIVLYIHELIMQNHAVILFETKLRIAVWKRHLIFPKLMGKARGTFSKINSINVIRG